MAREKKNTLGKYACYEFCTVHTFKGEMGKKKKKKRKYNIDLFSELYLDLLNTVLIFS